MSRPKQEFTRGKGWHYKKILMIQEKFIQLTPNYDNNNSEQQHEHYLFIFIRKSSCQWPLLLCFAINEQKRIRVVNYLHGDMKLYYLVIEKKALKNELLIEKENKPITFLKQ